MSRYFSSDTGEEQLKWMLDVNMPMNLTGRELERLGCTQIDKHLLLFNGPNASELIADECEKIKGSGLDYGATALVANLLLFNTQGLPHAELKNAMRIQAGFIEATDLLRHQHRRQNLSGPSLSIEPVLHMIEHLDSVRTLFNSRVNWPSAPSNLPFIDLCLPITLEEEAWMAWQLDWFDKAFWSVPASDAALGYFFDRAESASSHQEWSHSLVSLLAMRMREVAVSQPDLAALGDQDVQLKLMTKNGPALVSLCTAKFESLMTGPDQVRYLLDP
jgi:hypothetical protein